MPLMMCRDSSRPRPARQCVFARLRQARTLGAAAALGALALGASAAPGFAVQMDRDARQMMMTGFPATGHVSCGAGAGTAQLVGSQSVIVTAAHVLFGPGGLRSRDCGFSVRIGGGVQRFAIDPDSIIAGTQTPYGAPAAKDWAVARLASPASGIRPLALGGVSAGQAVSLVSARQLPASGGVTVEACQVRAVRAAAPGREILLDCSAQAGDSGAAIVGGDGRMVGLYVGFRSIAPHRRAAFSETEHYNFAVAPPEALREAIRQLAR